MNRATLSLAAIIACLIHGTCLYAQEDASQNPVISLYEYYLGDFPATNLDAILCSRGAILSRILDGDTNLSIEAAVDTMRLVLLPDYQNKEKARNAIFISKPFQFVNAKEPVRAWFHVLVFFPDKVPYGTAFREVLFPIDSKTNKILLEGIRIGGFDGVLINEALENISE